MQKHGFICRSAVNGNPNHPYNPQNPQNPTIPTNPTNPTNPANPILGRDAIDQIEKLMADPTEPQVTPL
jgi:hypothetical protein